MKKLVFLVLGILSGTLFGAITMGRYAGKKINRLTDMSDKHLTLFLMMDQWIKIKQQGKDVARYLKDKEYNNIAVYGMSYAGKTLVEELKGSEIQVKYGIDNRADPGYTEIDIMSLNNELKKVDAVIVTAITFFDEIERKLSKKINCPVISLEDILYGI